MPRRRRRGSPAVLASLQRAARARGSAILCARYPNGRCTLWVSRNAAAPGNLGLLFLLWQQISSKSRGAAWESLGFGHRRANSEELRRHPTLSDPEPNEPAPSRTCFKSSGPSKIHLSGEPQLTGVPAEPWLASQTPNRDVGHSHGPHYFELGIEGGGIDEVVEDVSRSPADLP